MGMEDTLTTSCTLWSKLNQNLTYKFTPGNA